MKNELFTDEQLAAAMGKIQQKHLNDLPDSPEPHDFSSEFEKKMTLVFQMEHRQIRVRRMTRRAIAALLAIVLGLGLFLSINPEASAVALVWIRQEYNRYVSYLFHGDNDGTLPRYMLTWVPEDCVLYKEENGLEQTIVYYNPVNHSKGFTVAVMPLRDDQAIVLGGTDAAQVITTEICGHIAQLYTFPDHYILVWVDEKAGAVFTVTGTLNVDELLQLAEGLVPVR